MKQKSIVRTIAIEPYDIILHICVGDRNECNAKLKRKYKLNKEKVIRDYLDGASLSLKNHDNSNEVFVIFLKNVNRNNDYSLDTIAHECYHTVDFICSYIGSKRNEDVNEHEAYLMGYLFRECLKTGDMLKNKNKRKK
jgi:hypothetical protein